MKKTGSETVVCRSLTTKYNGTESNATETSLEKSVKQQHRVTSLSAVIMKKLTRCRTVSEEKMDIPTVGYALTMDRRLRTRKDNGSKAAAAAATAAAVTAAAIVHSSAALIIESESNDIDRHESSAFQNEVNDNGANDDGKEDGKDDVRNGGKDNGIDEDMGKDADDGENTAEGNDKDDKEDDKEANTDDKDTDDDDKDTDEDGKDDKDTDGDQKETDKDVKKTDEEVIEDEQLSEKSNDTEDSVTSEDNELGCCIGCIYFTDRCFMCMLCTIM